MRRLLPALPLMYSFCLTAAAAVVWEDDFSAPARYELHGPRAWDIAAGLCRFRPAAGDARLVALTPVLTEARAEADLTVASRSGATWSYAGLCLFSDPQNHWQLMLVAGPDGRRYIELIERLDGVHQAQSGAGSKATLLAGEVRGELREWDYGKSYHLTVSLSPTEIVGRVTDLASGGYWERQYALEKRPAVKSGRPGLVTSALAGHFTSFRAQGAEGAGGERVALTDGRAGKVAILSDRDGRVAPGLAEAFADAGFGVTQVGWQELSERRLPLSELDLLVLADARTLPLAGRDELLAALHTGGKIMCIGAPALAELMLPTPDGFRGENDWKAAYIERLPRTPIALDPGQWTRASDAAADDRDAIVLDAAEGEGCWKITCDLKGWTTWGAEVPGFFSEGNGVLVFDAKGDAATSQMVVELNEEDGSRWIACVDLTPGWRSYALRPEDFPYWEDSTSEGRGGPGDRVRPGNVRRLIVGLARSHNSRVLPGPHTYWVRGLSSSSAQGLPEASFSVPEVEALCPSYKLYPMDSIATLRAATEQGALASDLELPWAAPGFSPVWRERGRGFDRGRSWRWVPLLEAYDAEGRKRGALLSLTIGDGVFPNSLWANVAVAEPRDALQPALLPCLIDTARAMVSGSFLLEAGAELFSYKPGEQVRLGAEVLNAGKAPSRARVDLRVIGAGGETVYSQAAELQIRPGWSREVVWSWTPETWGPAGYDVSVTLSRDGGVVDVIGYHIDAALPPSTDPRDFVRVEGSDFMLGDEKWFFKGINYRPNWVGGYPHLNLVARECYDPEIIERDLAWMESIGINAISAVHALAPPAPENPTAFRDQQDFLDRMLRHGIRCFFIVPHGRPYEGEDAHKLMAYIESAGIKDHPAVMCWELAWEPIVGPWGDGLEPMLQDFNDWVEERYGSVANAVADWGFAPPPDKGGLVPTPTTEQCTTHGDWDRYVAAFRRAFSDIISRKYRDVVLPLRRWDPLHLISFRGGACGIPEGHRFAHIHSVGVSRLMDFLNPEGYNLQTGGWAVPTPPEDIRRGGLVTLYYRYISREKPVVWMEFGFTVNGFKSPWTPERMRIDPARLELQEREYEAFYDMILESGSRGAAPWWLPGGFRLGENSDFGILEPDGTERPACRVLRKSLPMFAQVQHRAPTRELELDLDRHYPDAWKLYSDQYLSAVQAGEVVAVRSAGTGTDSASCPLTAVGGGRCTGHNPPQYLNAEFDALEIKVGESDWRQVRHGEKVLVPAGAAVMCRARIGNIGEAAWPAPDGGVETGRVYLAGREEYGVPFRAALAADTPFLGTGDVAPFELLRPGQIADEAAVSFEMLAQGRSHFGERRTVVFAAR